VALFPSPLYIKRQKPTHSACCYHIHQSCAKSINGTLFGMPFGRVVTGEVGLDGSAGFMVGYALSSSEKGVLTMWNSKLKFPCTSSKRDECRWRPGGAAVQYEIGKENISRSKDITSNEKNSITGNRSSSLQRFSLQSTGRRIRALPSHQHIAPPCPLNTP
jgi:hypothetical protein